MKHIDLFSGIGGFALAADRVWPGIEHTFVEHDAFCQAVLKKHYPNSTIHGDIRTFIADAEREGRERKLRDTEGQHRLCGGSGEDEKPFILTGGFPCQPFSHAGRRKGTEDDRYLWPEMFRVIQLYRPTWVIAENVAGLNSMVQYGSGFEMEEEEYSTEQDARASCEAHHQKGNGLRTGKGVLGIVVGDLEREGYSIQTFIIPACAVGAPHRRDRVWIVAHANSGEQRAGLGGVQEKNGEVSERNDNAEPGDSNEQWVQNWREVALATCHDGVDDGLPHWMDGVTISAAKHRQERLKACGNAIVPQVAEQVMRAMV